MILQTFMPIIIPVDSGPSKPVSIEEAHALIGIFIVLHIIWLVCHVIEIINWRNKRDLINTKNNISIIELLLDPEYFLTVFINLFILSIWGLIILVSLGMIVGNLL